ncbi:hypothetical protein ACHQM5_025152 [Ranunculus cassubicifolius]
MSVSGIHGQLLEVTVVAGNKLKDTEWISRQDPYVCLEYGSQKFRTRTCTDGGKNPSFQEKYTISLIEGLREMIVNVWNSNTLKYDDFIGGGKVQLNKVLSQGYDDSLWSLQSKTGRHAGEVRLIMHYAGAKASKPGNAHSASPYGYPSAPHVPQYSAPHVPQYGAPPPAGSAYPQPSAYPTQYPNPSAYPPNPSAYPPNQSTYPPNPSAYPPSSYPPPPQPSAYPPQPSAYPPQPYPPSAYPPQPYPPPPQQSSFYPPPPYY